MVTHSAALAAPVQSGSTLPIRLTHDGKASAVIDPPQGPLPSNWPWDLQLSPEGWGLLFANAVILVEGETELGALALWFEKISHETKTNGQKTKTNAWSARNITIFSVGGDHGFEPWVRYLSYYRVPWAIVCDGTILDPYQPLDASPLPHETTAQGETKPVKWTKRKKGVFLQVARAHDDGDLCNKAETLSGQLREPDTRPEQPTFDEVVRLGETLGVFTLANWFAKRDKLPEPPGNICPIESIDDLIEQYKSLRKADEEAHKELGTDASKVRRGLRVAEACDPPRPVRDLYNKLLEWFANSPDHGSPS
jgi:hypothetical protein